MQESVNVAKIFSANFLSSTDYVTYCMATGFFTKECRKIRFGYYELGISF